MIRQFINILGGYTKLAIASSLGPKDSFSTPKRKIRVQKLFQHARTQLCNAYFAGSTTILSSDEYSASQLLVLKPCLPVTRALEVEARVRIVLTILHGSPTDPLKISDAAIHHRRLLDLRAWAALCDSQDWPRRAPCIALPLPATITIHPWSINFPLQHSEQERLRVFDPDQ